MHYLVLMLWFTLACTPTPIATRTPTDPVTEPPSAVAPEVETGPYARCDRDIHVGGIEIRLHESFTTAGGSIADGVAPFLQFVSTSSHGDCELLEPPTLVCDPACTGGQTCGFDGDCVPYPLNLDLGTLRIDGLTGPIEMPLISPISIYNFSGDLTHPGFDTETHAVLWSLDEPELALAVGGFDALHTSLTQVALDPHAEVDLTWTAQDDPDVRIQVQIDIANHGGTPARIECLTDDDGSLVLDPTLIGMLLDVGFSGFPTVTLRRQRVATQSWEDGCIEFSTLSEVVLPAVIDGLQSCSDPGDCTPPQTCLPNLTCG